MAFDYKKEYKDLYQPKRMPAIVTVPAMRFVAVDGVGDPNEEGLRQGDATAVRHFVHHQNEQEVK